MIIKKARKAKTTEKSKKRLDSLNAFVVLDISKYLSLQSLYKLSKVYGNSYAYNCSELSMGTLSEYETLCRFFPNLRVERIIAAKLDEDDWILNDEMSSKVLMVIQHTNLLKVYNLKIYSNSLMLRTIHSFPRVTTLILYDVYANDIIVHFISQLKNLKNFKSHHIGLSKTYQTGSMIHIFARLKRISFCFCDKMGNKLVDEIVASKCSLDLLCLSIFSSYDIYNLFSNIEVRKFYQKYSRRFDYDITIDHYQLQRQTKLTTIEINTLGRVNAVLWDCVLIHSRQLKKFKFILTSNLVLMCKWGSYFPHLTHLIIDNPYYKFGITYLNSNFLFICYREICESFEKGCKHLRYVNVSGYIYENTNTSKVFLSCSKLRYFKMTTYFWKIPNHYLMKLSHNNKYLQYIYIDDEGTHNVHTLLRIIKNCVHLKKIYHSDQKFQEHPKILNLLKKRNIIWDNEDDSDERHSSYWHN